MNDISIIWVIGIIGVLMIFLPRLENRMDEVLLGQRVANHKYFWSNLVGALFIIAEITLDIILNLN